LSNGKKIQKKGRNYGFPSLACLVGGLGDRLGDRFELLNVFAKFAVAF